MALTGWSSSNYLSRSSPITTTHPFMLTCWGYLTSTVTLANTDVAITQTVTASGGNNVYGGLYRFANNTVKAFYRGTGTNVVSAVGDPTADDWFFMAGSFADANGVYAELIAFRDDSSTESTGSITQTPSTPTITRIGADGQATPDSWPNDGALAECAVWDLTGFTLTDIRSLVDLLGDTSGGNAPNPLAVNAQAGQPWEGALVAYWRLTDDSDLTDLTGNGHDMTEVGTLTAFGSHPPVEAVPGGSSIAAIAGFLSMMQRNN